MDSANVVAAQEWFDTKIKPLLMQIQQECGEYNAGHLLVVAGPKTGEDSPVWVSAASNADGEGPAQLAAPAKLVALMTQVSDQDNPIKSVIEPLVEVLCRTIHRYGCSMVMGIAPPSPSSVMEAGIGKMSTSLLISAIPDACGAMPLCFQNALRLMDGETDIVSDEQAVADAAAEPRRTSH